ncbi:MAG: HAMP domain-containing histidine kinase [Spirochaetales bacterium]|nr:HAMP domain-containing histidine kinase [Spirochaetales bacterium]
MNRKFTIILVIMVIIPIGLLSWMGFTSMKTEKDRTKQQVQYIGKQKLELVQDNITLLFKEIESDLNKTLNLVSSNIDEIRIIQRNQSLIKQIFIENEEDLIYPSDNYIISEREEAFLIRIKETDISFNFLLNSENEVVKESINKDWHTWFMGDGLNFIYWEKEEFSNKEVVIKGIELNRSALLSGIINSLPVTNEKNSFFRISLIDVNGNIIYQWGSFSPPLNLSADSTMSLEYPLSSWHLEYYLDPASVENNGNSLNLIVSLVALFFVILTLSIYLYRESTREMREASQKVSFVNQVSHELKTPLTNIRMYAELLEKKFATEDKKTKKHLDIIISESGRLGRLINNVLSFAREQKNGITFNPGPAVPDDIIQHTLDSFSYSLKTKGIKLSVKLNASSTVLIDADILEQILSNLISNVEKYAVDGKWIKVESSYMDEAFILTVSDRGPGIPDDFRERIFEPFFRVSNKLTDGVSGTGIGLSLVRILSKTHGGKVFLLSNNHSGKNEGAVFQVKLKTPLGGA